MMGRCAGGVLVAALAVTALGCGGRDPLESIRAGGDARAQTLGAIVADSALTAAVTDTLLDDPRSREILVDRVVNDGEAMQSLMAKIARNPAAVDGIVGLAVQESTMKAHVLTLLRGIQIGEGAQRFGP